MPRRLGFGLRFQLVVSLSVAFIVSFALLGIAALQLGERSRQSAHAEDARATAAAIAAALDGAPVHARFVSLADRVIGIGSVRGVELEREEERWVRGVTSLGTAVEAPLDDGLVRVWVRPATQVPMNNLLLLYVAFTGGAILLLTYLGLTYLIVRPIERVTQAAERVAGGQLEVALEPRGAAEVARLATSFNDMSRQIRRDRVALEERLAELERTTRELESAQEQILRSAKLASVGRLAAGIAHEIGNPLAAVVGLIEIARDPDLDAEERDEFLTRIEGETQRIHKIIRELLDFARQGEQSEEPDADERVDLGSVIEDAVRLVTPQHDAAKLRIEQRVADIGSVPGSADKLTQVLLNLLLNAADAVGGEGEVRVELEATEEEAILSVSDSGPGIDEALMGQLFEPFVTSKPVGEGTGLGLAVCHSIVEAMGGTIEASNPVSGGARFEIRLPR